MRLNTTFKNTISALAIGLLSIGKGNLLSAQSHCPGQQQDKLKIKETEDMKAYAFDLKDVKLLDSQFTDNMKRESKWILSLSTDQFLHNFRINCGIKSSLKDAS